MASSLACTPTEPTERTHATTPTISCPPADTAAAIDLPEVRPPAGNESSLRVLVLTLEEGGKVNTFQAAEALSKFGTAKHVYRHNPTKLEVTMSSEAETCSLLSAKSMSYLGEGKTMVTVPISVTLHPTKKALLVLLPAVSSPIPRTRRFLVVCRNRASPKCVE